VVIANCRHADEFAGAHWKIRGAGRVLSHVDLFFYQGDREQILLESTEANIGGLHKRQLLQEHHSPELRFFKDEVIAKGRHGVFYWADRETYISLGFNTSHISVEEAPKSTKDLLDPKFKGKISLAGGAMAARSVGAVINALGRDFIKKLARQDVTVHKLSGAALANLVITGEVPISPTNVDSNIFVAKNKGAPVEWRPMESVVANVGYSSVVAKAPCPYAALLFIDYLHSKEGQRVVVKCGLSSPGDDVNLLVSQKLKRPTSKQNILSMRMKRSSTSGKISFNGFLSEKVRS
jgi:ABC-type thiamine transport system substrate-binding protein